MKTIKKLLHNTWDWVKPYLTWRMVPFLAIAWMITNGWAYAFVVIGPKLGLKWMTAAGIAWVGLLWMPWMIEKPVTLWIAGKLYKLILRKDFRKKEVVE